MKVTIALGVLAFSLVVRHAYGQQSCYCSSIDCSCTNSIWDAVNGDVMAPGNPPVGSREFLTPMGDYQSPSTSAKPVRAVNRQQYIWVGASMISSSSNAIVLVRAVSFGDILVALSAWADALSQRLSFEVGIHTTTMFRVARRA